MIDLRGPRFETEVAFQRGLFVSSRRCEGRCNLLQTVLTMKQRLTKWFCTSSSKFTFILTLVNSEEILY